MRLLFFFLLIVAPFCVGQDINYSNIQCITQLYNPALTASNNDIETSINYRNQWKTTNSSFVSYGASFATTLMPKRRSEQGNLTMGINFYREEMNSNFNLTSALATTCYHVFFSEKSRLSVGLNYGIYSLGSNSEDGQWASQHDGNRYNPNLPSGENYVTNTLTKFDAGAGIQYSILAKKISVPLFQVGVAGFHLNQPKLQFLNGSSNQLPIRAVIHGQLALPLGKKGSYIQGNLSHQQQSRFYTTTVGINTAIKLNEAARSTSSVSKIDELYAGIGCATRVNDAFILNLFLQKTRWNIAFAYDFTISRLAQSNHSKGALEFSLQYNIPTLQQRARY